MGISREVVQSGSRRSNKEGKGTKIVFSETYVEPEPERFQSFMLAFDAALDADQAKSKKKRKASSSSSQKATI